MSHYLARPEGLARTSAGAKGLLLAKGSAGNVATRGPKESRFKLCLNTSTNHSAGLQEQVECGAKAGYKVIESWAGPLHRDHRAMHWPRHTGPSTAIAFALLMVLGAHQGAAEVLLQGNRYPSGVRYAADQLKGLTDLPVTAQVGGQDLPEGLTQKGSEAFALIPQGRGFRVAADGNAGLMYGLLELRDRLQSGALLKELVVSAPALRLRGDMIDFPFYLGVDLYNGRWRNHANIERKADSWWLDRGHWAWRLRRCAELRMNALLLCHPHPFPALIDFPDMPEAAYLEPEHLKRLHDHFAWILDEAEAYGVKVYFLTWNIWVSPGFAKAHNLKQEGPDGDLVRAYTRICYRRLFETYPKLAGIMTMAAEAPPGCVDFVREGIAASLNKVAKPPELLFWMWCSYPEDAKVIFEEYKGRTNLVHYLQYEQLFRPQADPRIKRASEALGGVPVITVGGLGTATGWLYWSDPYYLRDIMADLPRQNGAGCFFSGLDSFDWIAEKWLGWEGLARYGWNPQRPQEDGYWQTRITKRFGVPQASEDFLRASIAASAIPTRLLALLHRQTDHFMPQFGLPLSHYLGLPTLSTYVFENHERIDEKGRLVPRLGLTWPNPDWGEKVVGVVDFARGDTRGTTPLQIADELQRNGEAVLGRVARLRDYSDRVLCGAQKWNRCLDQMQMNGHLGLHTAEKTRAAVAWEQWRLGKGVPEEVLAPLERSVQAIERMAEIASRLYAGIEISTFRPGISRPWPWTNLQIWNTDRYRKHDFADSAAMFRCELEWVKRELAAKYPQPLLPFEDDLAPKPENGKLLLQWDFEGAPPEGLKVNNFPPDAIAKLDVGEAQAPLAGRRLIAKQNAKNFWFPLTTDPKKLPLVIGKSYWVSMDYWILEDAEVLGDWLSAGARTTEGGWQQDIGARYMGGVAGTRGKITLAFTPHTWKDLYVYVSLYGPAKIEGDNLTVWEGEN